MLGEGQAKSCSPSALHFEYPVQLRRQGPDDLQAHRRRLARLESGGQPDAVIADLEPQLRAVPCERYANSPSASAGEGVPECVADQLVDQQRARDRKT